MQSSNQSTHPKTFDEYMQSRITKLQNQFESGRKDLVSNLFAGLSFYIHSYTEPSFQQLKADISSHNGSFFHYYDKDKVSHVLTEQIPENKFKLFSTVTA